ncbi:TetR/AcrR family transcriptional regulator [Arenibacter sp. 6A1]|uniref:TetR/AcrR family transcriptional regulator n=1 Tax=Arenibacter sp. 6A1 TaxID=2720391 RepID=UPI0014457987|nr:TetR/AcrR family transcriptional regulator [Arenibacter sp. 6A1]NKI26831.1 TetR/AcrR family transcriptional regulator [Arenibacter sp. 6A1]
MERNLKRMATMHRMQAKGLEMFYQNGYFNTSIDDILKELSLSKGGFYYHFNSKEEYFISIVQQLLFRKVYSQLVAPIEGKEDPLHTIADCLDKSLETAELNFLDYGFELGNFINEFNGKHPEVMRALNDILKVWEVCLITVLQKGKTDGFVSRHADSEAIASFIISSYMGIRTLMVDGNAKNLRYKYMSQLRHYFKLMEHNETV